MVWIQWRGVITYYLLSNEIGIPRERARDKPSLLKNSRVRSGKSVFGINLTKEWQVQNFLSQRQCELKKYYSGPSLGFWKYRCKFFLLICIYSNSMKNFFLLYYPQKNSSAAAPVLTRALVLLLKECNLHTFSRPSWRIFTLKKNFLLSGEHTNRRMYSRRK